MKQEDLYDGLEVHFEAKAEFGDSEELTADNFIFPNEEDYMDFGEETEEWDVAKEKPGLWENIRKKKEREGKKYRPAKPGDKDRPDPDAWKRAQGEYKYKDPVTGEVFYFERRGNYKKNGRMLSFVSKAAELDEPDPLYEEKDPKKKDTSFIGKHQVTAPPTMTWQGAKAAFNDAKALCEEAIAEYEEGQMQREQLMKMHHQLMEIEEYLEGVEFEDWTKDMISKAEIYIQNIYDFVEARKDSEAYAAKYKGRTVTLNKPFKTPGGPKKSAVYVKNDKGNVVMVRFGDPNMKIKKNIPERRKSFRARHNCSNPGPKWKARYWSCKAW